MIDRISTITAKDVDWQASLSAGDTVSFRFPVAEPEGGPRPKSRPCLVLDVEVVDGVRCALLAYGTSAPTGANRGQEIRICGAEALAAAGLDKRTRFVCARRVLVRLSDSGFVVCRELGVPVLGHLVGEPLAQLERLRNRFSVAREMAETRGEHCGLPTARKVVVKRRRPWHLGPRKKAAA